MAKIALDELVARIEVDLSQLKAGLKQGEKAFGRSTAQMKKSTDGLNKAIGRIAASLAAAFSLRQIAGTADRLKLLKVRLGLVTDGAQDLEAVWRLLFEQAQKTGTSFESNLDAFARLALGSRRLGVTTSELLDVTEALNAAILIGGSSTSEASNGIIQFSQGMAAGALRGDELRSVLENIPPLADAIARGMGKTIGQLRELGAEGKLNTLVVLEALRKELPRLREEAGSAGDVLSRSWTRFANSLGDVVEQMDRMTGATSFFARSLDFLAEKVRAFPGGIKSLLNLLGLSEVGTIEPGITGGEPGQGGNKKRVKPPPKPDKGAAKKRESFFRGLQNDVRLAQAALEFGPDSLAVALENTRQRLNALTGVSESLRVNALAYTRILQQIKRDQAFKDIAGDIEAGNTLLRFQISGNTKLARLFEIENSLRRRGIELTDEQVAKLKTLIAEEDRLVRVFDAQEQVARELENIFTNAFRNIEDAIVDAMASGKFAFDDLRKIGLSVVNDLIRAWLRFAVTDPIKRALFGDRAGGEGGGLFKDFINFAAKNIGGSGGGSPAANAGFSDFTAGGAVALAHGGPVTPGAPHLVGERGPELFMPRTPGTVIPNHKMGGAGSNTVVNIDARGAEIGVEERIRAVLAEERPRLISDSVNAVGALASRGGDFSRAIGKRS